MYVDHQKRFGEETEPSTESSTEPSSETYGIQVKHEINRERIKAGLDPLPSEASPLPPPPRDNFAIGGISLLVIVFLLLSNS